MLRIVHVITGLSTGGAEMMLFKLFKHIDHNAYKMIAVSLTGNGPVGKKMEASGAKIICLNIDKPLKFIKTLPKNIAMIKAFSPDIVQGWLYHGNLGASIIRKLVPSAKLAWNLRSSKPSTVSLNSKIVRWINVKLSRFPDLIISNTQTGLDYHKELGYQGRNYKILCNGVDVELYNPNEEKKEIFRIEHNIPLEAVVVVMIARNHASKGYQLLLSCANKMIQNDTNLYFILAGRDVLLLENNLQGREFEGLKKRLLLLDEVDGSYDVLNAADIKVLASLWGEGFPNVLIEAMALEKLCVTTNTGDSAYVVDEIGFVVPPNDEKLLSNELIKVTTMPLEKRINMGKKARLKVMKQFDILSIKNKYQDVYTDLVK
jgi:glycosyltransferase involved in cell wall biosynthesis